MSESNSQTSTSGPQLNQDATSNEQIQIQETNNSAQDSSPNNTSCSMPNKHEFTQENPLVMNPQCTLIIKPSTQAMVIKTQPRIFNNLPSPKSLMEPVQPPSLFIQALSKINQNSLNVAFEELRANMNVIDFADNPPPDSLTSAPPSYSFVLRQMAARRRPRLMGTFIPSPSFVQHTPPPNYATAFDIYVDPVPTPPRVYNFGFASTPAVCPECGYTGMTVTRSKITICTHTCAFLLCVFCCWICVPLPYILKSCKDVYHHCRNCRNYLGMYCPTNPNSSYVT